LLNRALAPDPRLYVAIMHLCVRDTGARKCPASPILQVEGPVDTLGPLALAEAILGRIGTACIANLANGGSHTALLSNIGDIRTRQQIQPADLVLWETYTCSLGLVTCDLDDQPGPVYHRLSLAERRQRQQGAQPTNDQHKKQRFARHLRIP
jgi:hypothetical protein